MNKIVILIIALLAKTQPLISNALVYRQYETYIIIDQEEVSVQSKSWQKIQVTDLSNQAPVSYPTIAPKRACTSKEIS